MLWTESHCLMLVLPSLYHLMKVCLSHISNPPIPKDPTPKKPNLVRLPICSLKVRIPNALDILLHPDLEDKFMDRIYIHFIIYTWFQRAFQVRVQKSKTHGMDKQIKNAQHIWCWQVYSGRYIDA